MVQSPQVSGAAVPSGSEPVRMSWRFGLVAAAVDDLARLVERGLLGEAGGVVVVQRGEARGDRLALGVDPGAVADAVAGVLGGGGEIGAPGLAGDAGGLGEAGAPGVGAFEAAEVGALAGVLRW